MNERLGFLEASTAAGGVAGPQHPKGYLQPGVLVLSRTGRVIYRWRSVPTRKNVGGATGRPTPAYVWSKVEAALEAAQEGETQADVPLDEHPDLDSGDIPWPLFASLLIANGWFVRARGFSSPGRIPCAGARLLGFLAVWVAAFLWLPPLLVVVALLAWVFWIVPQVRFVNAEFQNETIP